jgi:hypothetical protein
LPAELFTVTDQRQGWSTTGVAVVVTSFALIGSAATAGAAKSRAGAKEPVPASIES